jgi:putative ABC transport system permease protein
MPGIVRGAQGQPLASLEMVTIINLSDPNGQDMNVNVRGITPVGFDMRDQVHLASGRWFQTGKREVVMGKSLADRFPSARIGSTLKFGRANGTWTVVGVLDGGRSVFNGEIWVDLNQISADDRRADYLSSVLLRAEPGQAQQLERALEHDARFNVLAQPEQRYYADQMVNARPIQFMGVLVAIIMAVGSVFAAMNTMYAAVARRSAEIGTLRVLGFSKGSILSSFVLESVFLAVLGGAIGCVLALPLNYINTDVGSFTTWSHFTFNFNVNTTVMLWGMAFALFIGAAGGFLPARNAAKRQIIAALKAR